MAEQEKSISVACLPSKTLVRTWRIMWKTFERRSQMLAFFSVPEPDEGSILDERASGFGVVPKDSERVLL
jgi:hypothetical protein